MPAKLKKKSEAALFTSQFFKNTRMALYPTTVSLEDGTIIPVLTSSVIDESESARAYLTIDEVRKMVDSARSWLSEHVKMSDERLLTSHDVGRLLQMDPSSIVKWVNDGLLPAYKTPGGHRRIKAGELRKFLKEHSMYIPPEIGN